MSTFASSTGIGVTNLKSDRDLELPEQYKGEINEALMKLKLDISELRLVNNSCPPHPNETFTDIIGGGF